MSLGAGVDAVTPGAGLAVGVGPVGEAPAREKAALDEAEHPLDAAGAIGIADGVGHEGEAEALGEGRHLGHGDHVPPGALEHDHVGVVDHAGLAGAVHVAQGLGEEDLAFEAAELRIELEEEHPGVAEHEAGGLHAPDRAAEVQIMRRGVVLHLLARREVVAPRRLLGDLADPMAAAEGGQGRIGELESGSGSAPRAPA